MPPLKYLAGIVHHNSPEDLRACLESLAEQTLHPSAILVIDHGQTTAAIEHLRVRFPEVEFIETPNEGYAGGANRIVEAAQLRTFDYALVLNPDIVLDTNFAVHLERACKRDPNVAIASGKLLRPDGRTIDSAGITIDRSRRPRDRGSEEMDSGQYDRPEAIFAVCGAAMWLRLSAAEQLAVDGELYDEDFVSYYEDTDLCWRANRLGMTVLYVPAALATHRRGWRRDRRFCVPVAMRRHSFKNHYLQLVKNERIRDLIGDLPLLALWELLRLGMVLIRDRRVIPAYWHAARCVPAIYRKRRSLRRREQWAARPSLSVEPSRSRRDN